MFSELQITQGVDLRWSIGVGAAIAVLVYLWGLFTRRTEPRSRSSSVTPPAPAAAKNEEEDIAGSASVEEREASQSNKAHSSEASGANSCDPPAAPQQILSGSTSASFCALSLSSAVSILPPTVASMYDAIPARLLVAPRHPSHVLLTDTTISNGSVGSDSSGVPACGRPIGGINLAAITVTPMEVEGAVALRIVRADRSAPVFVELDKLRTSIFGRVAVTAAPPPNWPYVVIIFTSERDRHRWLQLIAAHHEGRTSQTRALHQLYGTLARSILTNTSDAAAALCARWVISNEAAIVAAWSDFVHRRLSDVSLMGPLLPPALGALDRFPPKLIVNTVDISTTSTHTAAFSLPVLRNIRRCVMADRTSNTAAPGEINLEGDISWEDGFSVRAELITGSFGVLAVDIRVHSLQFPGLLVSMDPAPSSDVWVALPQGGLEATGGGVEVDVSILSASVPISLAMSLEAIEAAVASSVRSALFESLTFPHYWRIAQSATQAEQDDRAAQCLLSCRAEVYTTVIDVLLDAHWQGARAEFATAREASLRLAEAAVMAQSRAATQSWLALQEQQLEASRAPPLADPEHAADPDESLISLQLDDDGEGEATGADAGLALNDVLAATAMGPASSSTSSSAATDTERRSSADEPPRQSAVPASVPRLDLRGAFTGSRTENEGAEIDGFSTTPICHTAEEILSPPPVAPESATTLDPCDGGTSGAVVFNEPRELVVAAVQSSDAVGTASQLGDMTMMSDLNVTATDESQEPSSSSCHVVRLPIFTGELQGKAAMLPREELQELRGAAVIDAMLALHLPRHNVEVSDLALDPADASGVLVITYAIQHRRRRHLASQKNPAATCEAALQTCKFLHTLAHLRTLEATWQQKHEQEREQVRENEPGSGEPLDGCTSNAVPIEKAAGTAEPSTICVPMPPVSPPSELRVVVDIPAGTQLEDVLRNSEQLRVALELDASLITHTPRGLVRVLGIAPCANASDLPALDVTFSLQRSGHDSMARIQATGGSSFVSSNFIQTQSFLASLRSRRLASDLNEGSCGSLPAPLAVNTSGADGHSVSQMMSATDRSLNMSNATSWTTRSLGDDEGAEADARLSFPKTLSLEKGGPSCSWSKIRRENTTELNDTLLLDASLALHVPRSKIELAQVTVTDDDSSLEVVFSVQRRSLKSATTDMCAKKIRLAPFHQTMSLVRNATRTPAPGTPIRVDGPEGLVYLPQKLPSLAHCLKTPRDGRSPLITGEQRI